MKTDVVYTMRKLSVRHSQELLGISDALGTHLSSVVYHKRGVTHEQLVSLFKCTYLAGAKLL
jgi:hypothetical protein